MNPSRAREVLADADAGVRRLIEALRSVGLLTAKSTICTLCGVSCPAGETVPHRAGCLLGDEGAILFAATLSEAAREGAEAIAGRALLVAERDTAIREIEAVLALLDPRAKAIGLHAAVESLTVALELARSGLREAEGAERLYRAACGLATEIGGPNAQGAAEVLARAAAADLTAADRKLLEARWASSVTVTRRDVDGGLLFTAKCRDCRLRRDLTVSQVEITASRVPLGPEIRRRLSRELPGLGCPHPFPEIP